MKKITYKDLMPELYEMFDILATESLDKVISTGLTRINRGFLDGEELLLEPGIVAYKNFKRSGGLIKFYKKLPPSYYRFYIAKRNKKRARINEKAITK